MDFDKDNWREDVKAFTATCKSFDLPAHIEISRSGQGAHVWIFFSQAIPAHQARLLGSSLISHTCATNHQLDLSSYDRLFPNQDKLPNGGFGNLIALPLQKQSREQGGTVFVDHELNPIEDQWEYLASVEKVSTLALDTIIEQLSDTGHSLDVSFIDQEDLQKPWKRATKDDLSRVDNLPETLELTLSDKLYVRKDTLPQPLQNRLIRLAAFQNPEFYKAQAMRFPVWGKPRVIGCAENYPFHIALPRGCLDAVVELLKSLAIKTTLSDERNKGTTINVSFNGKLYSGQKRAVDAMLMHDTGILYAPTAFGKTVAAAAIVSERQVNTLIVVHRADLQTQWHERLQAFLNITSNSIGRIGGGYKNATGVIDIAVVQSLVSKGHVNDLVEQYGQVIIDECHHVGAQSFEAILKRVKALFVMGLTATPERRDGQQPIIYMQCGPIRHRAKRESNSGMAMIVRPHHRHNPISIAVDSGIQQVFLQLTKDSDRTEGIAKMALQYLGEGRKVLVLTERTDHIESLRNLLPDESAVYMLHGRIPKKTRANTLRELNSLAEHEPRLLLATGKLIGEGFDHAALDVLILAMPVSWKGTLQQYVGRLHRTHQSKSAVTVVDIVDWGHPALIRMWEKRQRGYLAMGYEIADKSAVSPAQLSILPN